MVSVRPMEQRRRRKKYVTVFFFVDFCENYVADGLIEPGINFGSDFIFCVAGGPSGTYGVTEEIARRPIYGARTTASGPHFFCRPSDVGISHVVEDLRGGK